MAIYEVESPDGRKFEVEGPEGATKEDLINVVRQQYYNKPQPTAPDTAEGGFGAALSSGVEGVKAAGAAVAGRLGLMDEQAAQSYIEEKQRRQQEIFRPTEEGWTEAFWTKFKETLGGSLPYIAAPVVGALAAKPLLAGTAAAGIAGTIGGLAAGTAQFTGTNLLRQMDEGKKLSETDLAAAGITAPAQAALDVIGLRFVPGIRKIFADAGKEISEAAAKKIAERGILSNALISGGKAATAEGFTETGQQLLERLQAGLDITDKAAQDEYLESFISGSVLGGTFGGVGGVGARGRARERLGAIEQEREQARLAAEEAAQQEVTPEAPATPTTQPDFLTPEEARLQKQRAAIEQFGLETEFPPEMARTPGDREAQQRAVQAQLDAEAGVTPEARPGPVSGTQGDLFMDAFGRARAEGAPVDVQRQLLEAAGVSQPTAPTIAQPEAPQQVAPEAVPVGQMALPLVGGRTATQANIESYLEQQNQQAVEGARAIQAERQALGEQAAKQREVDALKFESDLAQIDGLLRSNRRKTVQDNRLGLLLPLIENPEVTNIPKAFGRALQQAGIADLEFTARERNLIARAYDVRGATITAAPAPEVMPATANEMPADLVKERGAAPTQPQQLSFPGLGKQSVEQAAAKAERQTKPEAAPEVTPTLPAAPITEESLNFLKLPKSSALRKRLLGKDISNPAQRQQVNTELRAALANPSLPEPSKKAIRAVLEQSEFTRQGEMFGPRGGILEPSTAPMQQEAQNGKPVGRPDQPSVGVDGMGGVETAPDVGTPGRAEGVETGRLATPERGAGTDVAGTEKAQPALKTEPKAEAGSTAGSPFAMMVKQLGEPEAPKTAKAKGRKYDSRYWDKETPSKLTNQVSDQLTNVKAAPLYVPLPVHIKAMLRRGDLIGALRAYAEATPGEAGRIATVLGARMQGVKVRVMPTAEFQKAILERSGEGYGDATGAFYGSTNEIYLDENLGFDGHTLLHESTHAVADRVLDNPAHPLTKKLQVIYDAVGKNIQGTYGVVNLKEFAAEAFSNQKFRELLDSIPSSEKDISLLTKFTRAINDFVRNLLGMAPAKYETALQDVDRVMHAIAAPGVNGTAPVVSAQQASFMRKGDEKVDTLARAVNAMPFGSERTKDSVDNFLRGTAPGAAKTLLRAMLPLNSMVDVAKKYLKSAPQVDELVNLKSGYQNHLINQTEPIVAEASKFAKKASLDDMRNFNKVVYLSTLEQVDPSKPRGDYAGDAAKQKVWDELNPMWNRMAAKGGQQLYARMRDTYAKMYDEIGKVIGARIDDTDVDAETKRTVKTQLLAKMMERTGNIEPYFPLVRRGDFWLSYNIKDPRTGTTEPVIEAYESERARQRAIDAIGGDAQVDQDSIETFAKINEGIFRGAPTGSFINSVLKTLDAGGIDQETKNQIMQLFLNSLPESAIVQAFRKRKGTLGFEQDALRAFKERSFGMARQLANIKYSAKLSNLDAQLREEAKTDRGQEAKDMYEELHKRIQFAISPDIPKWSQVATSLTFASTLGFNLSSAVVNLSQIPLVVLPYLGGKYGLGATARAIGRASKVFAGSGTTQQRQTILGDRVQMRVLQSLDNYNFDDPKTPPNIMRYKELAEEAGDRGQLNRSQTYDMLDVGTEDNLVTKVNAVSGALFHYGERMNRQISLMAAYDLELDAMKKKGRTIDEAARREAARTAIEMTELTNGGVASAAAPRIAQNALGKVMFMYKRYGVSMYYMLFKTARESLKSADPKVRKAAKRQIAGIYASAALISGVQGVPLFGVAALMYDLFKEDDEDDFRTETRKFFGEQWYKGMVNDFTGFDIASRVGLSDLLYRDNTMSKNTDPMLSLMQTLGGPVFGVAQKTLRGINDIQEGHTMRGIEQILPSAFGNLLKAYRFGTEGALTRRGDAIMEEFSPGSVIGQAFGFTPADYSRVQETVGKEKEKERARLDAKAKLLTRFYVATREGDASEAQAVLEKIGDFNQRNPALAITPDALRRSVLDRAKVSAQMIGGVSFNKKLLPEVMANLAEYDAE